MTTVAFALFDGAREAATELPEPVGIGFGIANTIYNTVLEIATITVDGTESADEPFSVKAGDVGSELVSRLSAAQDTLTGSVAGAIVADYGKLKTVGICSQGLAACPEDPRAWLFDADD